MSTHTKEQAANIAEDFGLDLSSVTRAFYRQIVREHGIPPLHWLVGPAPRGPVAECGMAESPCRS